MKIKKYLTIMQVSWCRQLTFRLNFLGFRLANIVEIGGQIIVWSIIYSKIQVVNGYSYNEMITYVIIGWLFLFITSNYGIENVVAKEIYSGSLSNMIVKPVSYLRYTTFLSLGRVSIALTTAVILMLIFVIIFRNNFIYPSSWQHLILIVVMVFFGYFINLFYRILSGFVAFWTIETNGLFTFFNVVFKFMAGAFFPLNLLPDLYVKISYLLPFTYIFYFPTQLYLGKLTLLDGLKGLGAQIIWIVILYFLIKIIWKKGLKKYESVGM